MARIRVRNEGFLTFVEGFQFENGEIGLDDDIPQEVLDSSAVIFKSVFPKPLLDELREAVVSTAYPYNDYTKAANGLSENFKRVDDLRHRERRARYSIGFALFFWNRETPPIVNDVTRALVHFGNRLAQRPIESRLSVEDRKVGTTGFYYYPPGGLSDSHHFSDDIGGYDEVFDELVLQFTQYGVDFHEGGAHLAERYRLGESYSPDNHGPLEFVEPLWQPGDVLALTIKDVYHRVEPIDPGETYLDPRVGRFISNTYYIPTEDLRRLSK